MTTTTIEIAPPLPDEPAYSAFARAKYRMGWPTTRFSQRLFGGRTIIARPHLCGQIDLVATIAREVAGWSYTAEQIRDRFTLFPVISPLLNDNYWPKCTAALHGDRVSRHHVGVCRQLLGITPFTLLKSCPECRRTDRNVYGESYFHGVHQVPGVCVCAHHGCVLQECPVSAEPDLYIALDEVTEHRRLRVPPDQIEIQQRMASGLLNLMHAPEQPSSVANFLPLFRRLAGKRRSPILAMLSLTAAAREPLTLIDDQSASATDSEPPALMTSADARWSRLARRFLPARIQELRATYRRRIAWLTLRRELEFQAQARLPARTHIPRTAAYIDTFVETEGEAERRQVCMSQHDSTEMAAA